MTPSGPGIPAKDAREYIDLIDQAICEVEDLRDVVQCDTGSGDELDGYVDKLGRFLVEMKQTLDASNPRLSGTDLPFMALVNATDTALLPFKQLLLRINATNKFGYKA